MAGRVYFTSDLHLGHEKVAKLRGYSSVEEHDNTLIEVISDAVPSKRDVIWILGDIAFGRHNLLRLNEIPAMKKLVLGNHDKYAMKYYAEVSNKVFGAVSFKKDVILTHIPVSEQQKHRYALNVHGHLHGNMIDDPFYMNVCVEWGPPYSIGEIMSAVEENKQERANENSSDK